MLDIAELDRKQEFALALKEYLYNAELYPSHEAFPKTKTGELILVFGMLYFSEQDDSDNYHFLALAEAEQKLMDKVDNLFNSQVSPATVRSSLQRAITLLQDNTTFIFPFETKEQEQQYLDKIYELLNFHYERQYDAIVPMYQLECADGVEFPLADSVLYSGGRQSQLAIIANDDDNPSHDDDRRQIELCSYLKFRVTGDAGSRLEQTEDEVERSLQVMRFITPWFENDKKAYNPAHGVSMWKQSDRVIVFSSISKAIGHGLVSAEIPNGIFGARRINAELLRYAKEVRGLDDINYHFQNSDCNSVSKRICRALSFYDTAAQTSIIHVAFSNFIISVDILLPPKNVAATVLTGHLQSLIEHAKYYTGEMQLDTELADPESTTWPERVRLTTTDFRDFYTTRGQILHGNEEERYKTRVSKLQVKKARQIAHNAIRAYAYLAQGFQWKNDKEAKNWFKAPCKPPKEIADSAS